MPGGVSGLYPSLATKRRKDAEKIFEESKASYKLAKEMLKEAKKIERISKRGKKHA